MSSLVIAPSAENELNAIEEENDIVRILHFYHGSQDYLARLLAET